MSNRQKWLYTAAILGSMFFMASAQTLRGSLLTSLIDFYSLTSSQQGLPATAVSLGSMLAMALSFFLIGKVNKPKLLLIAVGIVTLLLFPQFLAPAYAAFIALNLLFGLAIGVMDTLISSSMADVHTGKRSALMMCILHACYGIGGIVAPFVYASMMNSGVEWNYLFLALAVFGIALVIYMTPVTIRQAKLPMYAKLQSTGKLSGETIRQFMKDKVLVSLTLLMLFFGLFFGGSSTWIIRFVNQTYASKLGNTTLSLLFLGVTVGRLVTPIVGIKPGAFLKYTGFISWAIMTIALLTRSDIATAVLACVAFFISGSTIPYALDLACGRMNGNTMMASTMLFLAMYVGQAISSPLIGALEGPVGLEWAMEICYIFACASSLCAILGLRGIDGEKL